MYTCKKLRNPRSSVRKLISQHRALVGQYNNMYRFTTTLSLPLANASQVHSNQVCDSYVLYTQTAYTRVLVCVCVSDGRRDVWCNGLRGFLLCFEKLGNGTQFMILLDQIDPQSRGVGVCFLCVQNTTDIMRSFDYCYYLAVLLFKSNQICKYYYNAIQYTFCKYKCGFSNLYC